MNGLLLAGVFSLSPAHALGAAGHVYKLAPLSILPEGLRNILRKSGTLIGSPSSIEKHSVIFPVTAAASTTAIQAMRHVT